MAEFGEKVDPIRDRYFRPVELAGRAADVLFWVGAALSLAAGLTPRGAHPALVAAVETGFVVTVVAFFVVGNWLRLSLAPRAETKRRGDFLSNAFGVALTHETTENYYTSQESESFRRIAAQVLENSIYSKNTAARMARSERYRVGGYALAWLLMLLLRNIDLGIVSVAAQVLFSEQVLARWLRIEWLKACFERSFQSAYRALQVRPSAGLRNATAVELFVEYECAKSSSGITLSEAAFQKTQAASDNEWAKVRTQLSL